MIKIGCLDCGNVALSKWALGTGRPTTPPTSILVSWLGSRTSVNGSPPIELELETSDAVQSALALVGRVSELGLEVDMTALLTMTDTTKPEIIRDLALYPWDLAPFWRESRLSKAHRFRQFPHHDLLGLFDPASTIHEPRWRYFINLDSLPWLRGHMVEGFTLYPGAGHLTMAIEATQQLVQMRGLRRPIAKFVLRNVAISKSIVLIEPDDSSSGEVEVQLSMSAANQYEGSRWESFRIRSYNAADGSWSEHCSGEITVGHETGEPDEVEGTREGELRREEAMEFLDDRLIITSQAMMARKSPLCR